MPWFLQVAIDQGLSILAWMENNRREDVPPQHIWEDPEALSEWWDRVRARRGLPPSEKQPDDDDMIENELAAALKREMA